MGYYPIKCVHCMRSVAMDERCVKMVPEEVKTFNSRLDGSQPIVVLNNSKKNKQIEYKSLRELRKSHVIEHEEIHPIKISGEYQNIEECRKDFVQSIDVKDLEINGTKMSGTIRKFYCPYCHNEIISMAGQAAKVSDQHYGSRVLPEKRYILQYFISFWVEKIIRCRRDICHSIILER